MLVINLISFGAVGLHKSRTYGSFHAEVIIENEILNLQIHIVPDEFLDHDLLIGGELSDLVKVRMKKREVRCFKLENETEDSNDVLTRY